MKRKIQKAVAMVIVSGIATAIFLAAVALLGWLVEFTCATQERFAIGLSILLAIVWNMIKQEIDF